MQDHERYMKMALELAAKGSGWVAPNPMVGCLILRGGRVIGQGYHQHYGQAHAEVEAINSVENKSELNGAQLYVNLEPCSHFGKTPPCCNLIQEFGIAEVFIGSVDSNPIVGGKGIEYLTTQGIRVHQGILEKQCRTLNKRFFTFHEKKRPYIILKWAQTENGFISTLPVPDSREQNKITHPNTDILVHQWRAEEAGIMVGTNTIKTDNPQLNVRLTQGKDPVKIIFDRNLELVESGLLKRRAKTIVITEKKAETYPNTNLNSEVEYIRVPFDEHQLKMVMHYLFEKKILSVLVEGGTNLLQSFIHQNLYDEIRVLTSPKKFERGLPAPVHNAEPIGNFMLGIDKIELFRNPENLFLP